MNTEINTLINFLDTNKIQCTICKKLFEKQDTTLIVKNKQLLKICIKCWINT
jgi:hypothetical protein